MAAALLAFAGTAVPQPPKPAAEPAPAREPARLNMKLDLPARSFTREPLVAPEGGADNLPSLGASARRLEPPAASQSGTKSSPFPEDTEAAR